MLKRVSVCRSPCRSEISSWFSRPYCLTRKSGSAVGDPARSPRPQQVACLPMRAEADCAFSHIWGPANFPPRQPASQRRRLGGLRFPSPFPVAPLHAHRRPRTRAGSDAGWVVRSGRLCFTASFDRAPASAYPELCRNKERTLQRPCRRSSAATYRGEAGSDLPSRSRV